MKNIAKNALRGVIRKQKGFTLIEILIVVILLGVVGGIIALVYSNSGASTARAEALESFTERASDMIRLTNAQLGSPNTASEDNALLEPDSDFLDVLVMGVDHVSSRYKEAFRRSGVGTIGSAVIRKSGNYTVAGYRVTLTGDVTAPGMAEFTFYGVPRDIVEVVHDEIEPGADFEETGKDDGLIMYTPANAGNTLYDMTIVQAVN